MNGKTSISNRLETWRLWVFVAGVGLIFLLFTSRLFILQILQGEQWKAKAEEIRVVI